jgi:hypothetical protein
MSQTLLTIVLTFVLVLLALAGLGIGKILTGKNRLRKMCGHTPNKKKGPKCGKDVTCPLCESEVKKPTEGEDE